MGQVTLAKETYETERGHLGDRKSIGYNRRSQVFHNMLFLLVFIVK